MTRGSRAFVLTALAAAVSSALAQEAPAPEIGYIGIGGIYTNRNSGATNHFKLDEYRDLQNGVTGIVDARFESADWWTRLFGENLGREDQFIELRGGKYGVFKYSLYDDRIVHNLTYGAITPFTGAGSGSLTFPGTAPPNTNLATWNQLDYEVKHENFGGFVEAQIAPLSPFYFRVDAKQRQSSGVKPLGAAGTSPGGPTYELPAPIDWTTTDWGGEVGYTSKRMHVALAYTYSKFENSFPFLSWRTPAVQTGPNIESSTTAPENKMQRWALNAIFKQMPFDSTLALRGTYAKYESDFAIAPTFLSVTGTLPAGVGNTRLANASSPNFDGEVVNETFSAAYNSNWSRSWSTKAYYNYYKRENNSSEIVFTPSGPGSGGTCDLAPVTNAALPTCTTEFLHFKKQNAGVEAYYRLNRANKLTFGADWMQTERERVDFEKSTETKLFAEWKSGMWQAADFRVKYIHLERDSDFLLASNVDPFNKYLYRFDVAPLKRDTVKFAIDGNPLPLLDLGLEINLKQNKYDETVLGRKKDKREEVSLSAAYGDASAWRVHAFADWEHTKYESTHWVGSTTTFPTPTGSAYFWGSEVHDRTWLFGMAGDWFVSDQWVVKASAIWQKGDGGVDFSAPAVANAQNITNYDDFQKRALNLRAVYKATRQVEVTFGTAYEKYTYSDIQMNDYINNIRTGANQNYLTGAYANPNYRATIIYGLIAYRF